MATADPDAIVRVPGRLVLNPTNLAAAFPHGGTALGVTRDQELRPNVKIHEEHAQEWGGATSRLLYCGTRAVFAAVFRSWDADALAHYWPESAAGAVTQERVVAPDVNADSTRAGRFIAGSIVLWSPLAIESAPAVLLFDALPMLDETTRLQLSLKGELGMAVMWACAPGSDGRPYAMGLLADLSLT